jgi:hypothetical protein
MKSSVYMPDHLCDPKTAHSSWPTETALNRAFDTSDMIFTWFGQPGNEDRRVRFQAGMVCMRSAEEVVKLGGECRNLALHVDFECELWLVFRVPLGKFGRWIDNS